MTASATQHSSVASVLNDLTQAHNGASIEKTASEETAQVSPGVVAQRRQELNSALQSISNYPTQKTASDAAPAYSATHEVDKLARQLEQAEALATIKEGQLFGAAAFDGWIQRANQYLPQQAHAEKVAQEEAAFAGQLQKIASAGAHDIDVLLNEYIDAAQQEKEASDGMGEGLMKMAEVCVDCFNAGFAQIQEIVAAQ